MTLGVAVLVAGVAASRVLLGAHWLTDVVGGLLLGLTWLAVFFPAAIRCAGSTDAGRAQASPDPPPELSPEAPGGAARGAVPVRRHSPSRPRRARCPHPPGPPRLAPGRTGLAL